MYRKSPKWPWIIRSKVTPYGLSSLLSPKFPTIHSTASRVRVTGHFQTSAPNHHKRTLNTKWSKVPNIEITTTPRAPNFTYFISTASRFQVTVHIETNTLNDPKMAWNTKGSTVLYIYYPYSRVQIFTQFHSMDNPFRVTYHFETSAPYEPQMT